jgi:hypothetical protein
MTYMSMRNDDEHDPSVVAGPVVGYLAAAIALAILLMA